MNIRENQRLDDLGALVKKTQQRMRDYDNVEINLSPAFKQAFAANLEAGGNKVKFDGNTAIIQTSGALQIYAPNQWFVIASFAIELVEEITRYRNLTEGMLDSYSFAFGGKEKKEIYKQLKSGDRSLLNTFRQYMNEYLNQTCDDPSVCKDNCELLCRFVSDSAWWLGGKGIERTSDYYVSPVLGALSLVNASQSYIASITYMYVNDQRLKAEIGTMVSAEEVISELNDSENEYQRAANLITGYISETGFEGSVTREEFNESREQFMENFAPEKLKALQGEDLLKSIFYTTGDNTDSLCCWIEMNKECRMAFGSIAGGSAYKFGLFQRKENGVWTTGSPISPQKLSEEEALVIGTEIRDALVKGTEVIRNASLNTITDYEKLDDDLKKTVGEKFYNWAWFHKYYSIVFPDKLSCFHSPDWQKHALRCFLIQPSEKYYARSGQLAMIQNYGNLFYTKFIEALRDRFSSTIIQFVRIGTSDTEKNYVADWKKRSVVGIGWRSIGSLQDFTAGDSLDKKNIADKLSEEYYPTDARIASRKAGELIRFYDTDINTIFVAMDGERLYGLVDEVGAYFYDGTTDMAHLKTGKWHSVFTENDRMPEKGEGILTSCVQLKDDRNLLYLYEKYFYTTEKEQLEDEQPIAEDNKLKTCLDIELEPRKVKIHPMNCIVYGAPGTGKTYSTAEYALAIIEGRPVDRSRKSTADRKAMMKKYNEYVKKGQIVFTTFHQNYGYEEFIQGLRPDTKSGKMSFKTVDGVFKIISDQALNDSDNNYVIIIDEINRANISKVFGELITLIEADKRWGELNETSATLQSGDAFAVPNNLYIVGTMNSADKSISLIDAALRRRFSFIEQRPEAELIEDSVLQSVLKKLNEILADELESSDLLIGHSYFMNRSAGDLDAILNNSIIPLMYEYFYDNKKKVASVLKEAIAGTDVEIVDDKIGRLRVKKVEG